MKENLFVPDCYLAGMLRLVLHLVAINGKYLRFQQLFKVSDNFSGNVLAVLRISNIAKTICLDLNMKYS